MEEAKAAIEVFREVLRGGGAEAVAVISLLGNFYLWRALRQCESSNKTEREEELKEAKDELRKLRDVSSEERRHLDSLVRMLSDRVNNRGRNEGS